MTAEALLVAVLIGITAAGPPIFIDHGVEPGTKGCVDLDPKCSVWASQGECQSNAAWMMGNCRRSCQSCQGGDRAWKLRTHIASKYDKKNTTSNFSINHVEIESLQLNHVEMDEAAQLMTVHGKLAITWNDSRIEWDTTKWGVSWLNFYWIQIWTPQIVQTNSPNGKPASISGKVLAANYTGQVFMWSDYSFTAPCSFDYSSYPTDKQRCCIKLDDKRYFSVRFAVKPTARDTAKLSAEETHASGWEVNDIDIREHKYTVDILTDWHRDPYALETSNCDICVEVKRKAAYYSSEIVGPAVATAAITISSFLIGGFHQQIAMLLVSIAMQIMSLAIVNTRLPPSAGGAPAVLKFYSFNMTMNLFSLFSIIILTRLAKLRTTIPPPHVIDKMLLLLDGCTPCCKEENDEEKLSPTENNNNTNGKCYWAPLANAIKCMLFALIVVLYVLMMFGCFAV